MKKILLSLLAFTLMSTTAVYADSGKKKAKAKKSSQKCCPEKKDCKKTAKCPAMPGCVCC